MFFASRAHVPELSRAVEAHGSSDSLAAPVFGTNADQHPNTSKRVRMHPNTFEHVGTHAKASKNVRKDVKTLRRVWKYSKGSNIWQLPNAPGHFSTLSNAGRIRTHPNRPKHLPKPLKTCENLQTDERFTKFVETNCVRRACAVIIFWRLMRLQAVVAFCS